MNAGTGVDDHTRRLIDRDNARVFVENGERDIFGLGFEGSKLRGLNRDEFGPFQLRGRLAGGAIYLNTVVADPGLQAGTAVFGKSFVQISVEPFSLILRLRS